VGGLRLAGKRAWVDRIERRESAGDAKGTSRRRRVAVVVHGATKGARTRWRGGPGGGRPCRRGLGDRANDAGRRCGGNGAQVGGDTTSWSTRRSYHHCPGLRRTLRIWIETYDERAVGRAVIPTGTGTARASSREAASSKIGGGLANQPIAPNGLQRSLARRHISRFARAS